jgi:beta-phosphoglucomutase-like phosphatase (HAD superfamily)
MAADRLDLAPHEVLVFEDSKVGITAGNAAKMDTVAVLTKFNIEQLADYKLKSSIKTYERLLISMI